MRKFRRALVLGSSALAAFAVPAIAQAQVEVITVTRDNVEDFQ